MPSLWGDALELPAGDAAAPAGGAVRGLRRPGGARTAAAGRRAPRPVRRAPRARARRDAAGPLNEPFVDLRVRLQPRARRTELAGERGGALLARVTAPPVDGRANDALCRLIAEAADVPPSRVVVVRGHTARDKLVRVEGADPAAVRAALGLPPV